MCVTIFEHIYLIYILADFNSRFHSVELLRFCESELKRISSEQYNKVGCFIQGVRNCIRIIVGHKGS